MKSGERLVWAAAFAQVIANVDSANKDPEYLKNRVAFAIVTARAAVGVLRGAAGIAANNMTGEHAEAWAMVRDMAGETH